MGNISPLHKKHHVEYGAFHSDERRDDNDCAVVAVAAATGADYQEVLAFMAAAGRKKGSGTQMHITFEAIKHFGYNVQQVRADNFIAQYPGVHSELKHVTSHHPDRFRAVWEDGNTYLFGNENHIWCVVNGKNIDWSRGRALRAKAIWRVEKAKTEGKK